MIKSPEMKSRKSTPRRKVSSKSRRSQAIQGSPKHSSKIFFRGEIDPISEDEFIKQQLNAANGPLDTKKESLSNGLLKQDHKMEDDGFVRVIHNQNQNNSQSQQEEQHENSEPAEQQQQQLNTLQNTTQLNLVQPKQRNNKLKRGASLAYSEHKSFSFSWNFNLSLILLPTNKFKQGWDILLIILLMYVTLFTPYKIAFINDGDFPSWDICDNIVDFIFLGDIFVNLVSAYYDDESALIINPRQIALNYLKGWFAVDLLSAFPFYLILDDTNTRFNSLARISKVPKIYRLFKMSKLARMIRMRDTSYIRIVSISTGAERFYVSFILLLLSCHIVGCMWYFISSMDVVDQWILDHQYSTAYEQYIVSLYWTVQTVLTVGYGDIHVTSWPSRLFAIFWMIFSVYVFSFAVGSLAAFLNRIDQANQNYITRFNVLKNIKKEFAIPNSVFNKVKRELKNDRNAQHNYNTLLDDLPQTLRIELGVIMHKNLINEIKYFQNKPPNFIATIGPLLTSLKVGAHEYIFMTGDPAEEIYFIKSGKVAVVLPQFNNFKFILIKTGSYFGELDLLFYGEKRKYTIMTTKVSEFYVLSRKHFRQIFLTNFRELGYSLIQMALVKKDQLKESYQEAIQFCSKTEEDDNDSKPLMRKQQKFITQKFTKSINSISSKSNHELSESMSKRQELRDVIQEVNEEEDQEHETENMMQIFDVNTSKKSNLKR